MRTRAILSAIVAWEESVVSTLAELLVGIRLAHANSCKAAARSEDDFFITSIFLGLVFSLVQMGGCLKLVLRSSGSLNRLDAGFKRSIRSNLRKSLKQYVSL